MISASLNSNSHQIHFLIKDNPQIKIQLKLQLILLKNDCIFRLSVSHGNAQSSTTKSFKICLDVTQFIYKEY